MKPQNLSTAAKRKRRSTDEGSGNNGSGSRPPLSVNTKNANVEVVTLDDDDDWGSEEKVLGAPAAKRSHSSSSSSATAVEETSLFRVPHVPSAKKRKSAGADVPSTSNGRISAGTSTSMMTNRDRNSLIPVVIPTAQEIRQTENSRQMRRAVVVVMKDVHSNISTKRGPKLNTVRDMLDNIRQCWMKYPLMFTSRTQLVKLGVDEDLSSAAEAKEFMMVWLHGLCSFLLREELAILWEDIFELLTALIQLLTCGNPSCVDLCFSELLNVLARLSQERKPISIPVRFSGKEDNDSAQQHDDTCEVCFVVLYKLDDSRAICNLLKILTCCVPRVLYFNRAEGLRLCNLLRNLWLSHKCVDCAKMLSSVLPLFAHGSSISPPVETAMCSAIRVGISLSLERRLEKVFQDFSRAMLKWKTSLNLFPISLVLRFNSSALNLLFSYSSDTSNDYGDMGVEKLVIAITHGSEELEYSMSEQIALRNAHLFQRIVLGNKEYARQRALSANALYQNFYEMLLNKLGISVAVANPIELNNGVPKRIHSTLNVECDLSAIWEISAFIFSGPSLLAANSYSVDLERSCNFIQLASSLSQKLASSAEIHTTSTCTVYFSGFLNLKDLTHWLTFVEDILQYLLETPNVLQSERDKTIRLVLDTIEAINVAKFRGFQIPMEFNARMATVAGIPYLPDFQLNFPVAYIPCGFLSTLSAEIQDNLTPSTMAKCIRTICSPKFLPWSKFIRSCISSSMEKMRNIEEIVALLQLIAEGNWVMVALPWGALRSFLHRVVTSQTFSLEEYKSIHIYLAEALVKMPCLFVKSFQLKKGNNIEKMKRMRLLMQPCLGCQQFDIIPGRVGKENEDNSEKSIAIPDPDAELRCMPKEELLNVLQLCLPLMRSYNIELKRILSKLICAAGVHCDKWVESLVFEFVSVAAGGEVSIGMEVMSQLGHYFSRKVPTTTQIDEEDRESCIRIMFETLLHFLYQNFQTNASVTFCTKVLIILKELAGQADMKMTLDILKFTMQLIKHRDSNVRYMLAQDLCTALASSSQPPSLGWELMIKLRYELAPIIIGVIREEFCNLTDYTEDDQRERVKSFLNGIVLMGDFRTVAVFTHYYIPVLLCDIVPRLGSEPKDQFILKCLGEFASLRPEQLLQDGFHIYYRSVVLDSVGAANRNFAYILSRYKLDLTFLASNTLQASLSEMLCYLHDRKDMVLKLIPGLLEKRVNNLITLVNRTRSEMQELLCLHLMGFFVHVDTKLHSRFESNATKRRILASFIVLIEYMGKVKITQNRSKVYATLNSLFSLGVDFTDLLIQAWKTFATCLESIAFGQMSAQILGAVTSLHEHRPNDVEKIMSFFINSKCDVTKSYYPELYFVEDFCKTDQILAPVVASVKTMREQSYVTFLGHMVKQADSENSHIRNLAVCKLHSILVGDYKQVKQFALDKEHPVVSELISSLLTASRCADGKTLMRLAECFGFLGAVDPFRFKREDTDAKRKSALVLTVTGPEFGALYLDLVIREFQEAQDTTDFDYCSCLIQQLLQHFKVRADKSDKIWSLFSKGHQEVAVPLLTSKYRVDKTLPTLDTSDPIYLSEYGKTFDDWLSNWTTMMCSNVPSTLPYLDVYNLLQFSKYMTSRNTRIASFLLPYITMYALVSGSVSDRDRIITEIRLILDLWIEQDKRKDDWQKLSSVKDSQAEMGTPEPQPKIVHDQDVKQSRCTQEIFRVLDHLLRILRKTKRLASKRTSDKFPPGLNERERSLIKDVLDEVKLNTISQVAFHCHDYKRALFYLEQDLKAHPAQLQDCLSDLQQIYVSLNDMDSVLGIAKLRTRGHSQSEIIGQNFAMKKKEEGVRNLELMICDTPDDLIATSGLLRAYLNLDEPRKAETLISGCISRNPHWEGALEVYQEETIWKLRDWEQLRERLQCSALLEQKGDMVNSNQKLQLPSSPSSFDVTKLWSHTVIRILSFVKERKNDAALKLLNETRLKAMNPLIAAGNDVNGYSRAYSSAVQLHILTEVEQVIRFIKGCETQSFDMVGSLKTLLTGWKDRDSALLQSQKFIDPILNVRKSLLEIVSPLVTLEAKDLVNDSLRGCWVTAAQVETKAGNFTRAFNCIVEAKKCATPVTPKVTIEHAKLLARKGDKLQALDILRNGINTFFPALEEWKRSRSQVEDPERQLCSEALLLYAKLNVELQLLNIESNVKNFENCVQVFKYNEKNYFKLAEYHDRLLGSGDDSAIQEKVVRYYANSLYYGCKYVYQSLSRLLTIWFDFCDPALNLQMLTAKPEERGKIVKQCGDIGQQMHATIRQMIKEVPAYVLLTAFSQMISRICHPNPQVWEILKSLVISIMTVHPDQTIWMTMALYKSCLSAQRRERCSDIYKGAQKKSTGLKKMITDYSNLSDRFIDLCNHPEDEFMVGSLDKMCKSLPKLISSPSFGDVLIPFQLFMSPTIPPNRCGHKTFDPFPRKGVFIRKIQDRVDIMASVIRPKRIVVMGSDGKPYSLLCKPKDDLRKDRKVMEVNHVVNWYLSHNQDCRERNLYIRVYAVTPISEKHGLLEWVPNLKGYRENVLALYKERGDIFSLKTINEDLLKESRSVQEKKKGLQTLLMKHPPLFSEWFVNNFNSAQSWYKARMAYVRTAAVMSVVGYVIGLGDRHGENLLLDSATGDLVHVDFNCLFNRGEEFAIPERVPFRLTHNMIEAMGPLGVEGVYSRTCQLTLALFRKYKDIFLSVLRAFVFDPFLQDDPPGPAKYAIVTPDMANQFLKHIRNRIEGTARCNTREINSELSVEACVSNLINEATSLDNLSVMYVGWSPFL